MKLGSMQPYFFPYLGYFALIKHSDRFIFFDTPQYIRHGWCNRNRILKQDGTPSYITVPIKKAPRETAIKDILIDNQTDWRKRIFGQLMIYKKTAPNYERVIDFMKDILHRDYERLSELAIDSTIAVSKYLGIMTELEIFSEMKLEIDEVNAPDEWALNMTKALHYDEYINPPGGMSFFDRTKYEREGITLKFLALNPYEYDQRRNIFVPDLSVIDAMMFCCPEEINAILDDYSLS